MAVIPQIITEFYCLKDSNDRLHCARLYLDIKAFDCNLSRPAVIIVMLNPGSFTVKKGRSVWDATLHRVKHIIDFGFGWIRVLNLSDIQNAKSADFFENLKSLPNEHSIFHGDRKCDLDKLVEDGQLVYFACGTNKTNEPFLIQAKEAFSRKNATILNPTTPYYHPLFRPKNGIPKWEDQFKEALNTNKVAIVRLPHRGQI